MIEMKKLKQIGLIQFLNNEKWDYDYVTIDGIDYFQWEDETPCIAIQELISTLTEPIKERIAQGDDMKMHTQLLQWLQSRIDLYYKLSE